MKIKLTRLFATLLVLIILITSIPTNFTIKVSGAELNDLVQGSVNPSFTEIPDSIPDINNESNIKSLNSVSDNGFEVLNGVLTQYTGDDTVVNIPADLGIVEIGLSSFEDCINITSITIPVGVEIIGEAAFLNCTNLTSVVIPNGVTTIENGAFYGCVKLTSINIPQSVVNVGSQVFFSTDIATPIIINNGKILCYVPYSYDSYVIPNTVTLINDGAFYFCENLTSVTIPNSVITIGEGAFINCTNLETITIPSSVKEIGDYAFTYSGINHPIILNGLKLCYVPQSYVSYTIPNNITSIGGSAFYGCSELTTIIIPSSVTSIGTSSFELCSGLTKITVPKSVTFIGELAFDGCDNLIIFGEEGSYTQQYAIDNQLPFLLIGSTIPEFIVGKGILTKYTGINMKVVIPANLGITEIGNGAFFGSNIISAIIPNGVTTINQYAFGNCIEMTTISIPNGVINIGSYAFINCLSLLEISIPDSVTTVGDASFFNTNISTPILINDGKIMCYMPVSTGYYTIPNTVTTISGAAFAGCIQIKKIEISNNVTTIGEAAFMNCSNLTRITIPNSVNIVGQDAFLNCDRITIYGVDNSVIQEYAIQNNIPFLILDRPAAPSDFKLSSKTQTTINVNWFGDSSVLGFNLYNGQEKINLNLITNDYYIFTGLLPNTTLNLILKSVNSAGESLPSNNVSVTSYSVPRADDFIIDNGVLTKFIGNNSSVNIPDNLQITKIGDKAFYKRSEISSITIPDGVISIANEAFSGCTGLTTIILPSSLKSIGNEAFKGCVKLTTITFPNSLISIGNEAFSGCSRITSLTIPSNVKSIGEKAFNECVELASISILSNDIIIGDCAFVGIRCFSPIITNNGKTLCYVPLGTQSYTIPNSVTSINGGAFYGSYITNVSIPNNLKTIGNYAFYSCSRLLSITIPNGVETIGDYAFLLCDFTSITIPNSVITIGNSAFVSCTNLTSITIPISVKSIGEKAFGGCYGITSVNILSQNTIIGAYAFENTKVTDVIIANNGSTLCYVPKHFINYIIPNGVTKINDGVFYDHFNIRSVYIPDSVKIIGNNAFELCTSLNSINMPNSITTIGDKAFFYCGKLSTLIFPDSLISIGNSAFNGSGLKSFIIPQNVTSIGAYAFNCTELTSVIILSDDIVIGVKAFFGSKLTDALITNNGKVLCFVPINSTSYTIPDGVTTISGGAFANCQLITSIVFPESVTTIGNNVFEYCNKLQYINLPNSVISIGNNAFLSSGLISIVLPNSVTTIGNAIFEQCQQLRTVTLSDSLINISDYMFAECRNLSCITIPNSVVSIGEGAFSYCFRLVNLILPNSVTSIGDKAFDRNFSYIIGVNPLSLTIPKSVTSIGNAAFNGCINLKIYGYTGSNAHKYTAINNIRFDSIVEAKNEVEISLNNPTIKKEYVIGQDLDLQGTTLAIIYDNGTSQDIPISAEMVSGYDPNLLGEQQITVTYNNFVKPFTVTVVEKVITQIGTCTFPNKTLYFEGESLDITGLQIRVIYNDTTYNIINVTDDMISVFDPYMINNQYIIITYEGFSTYFEVFVRAKTATNISMKTNPFKVTYIEGQTINLSGAIITINYNNGTTQDKAMTADMVTGYNKDQLGNQTVTVTYLQNVTTFTITVIAKSTTSIAMKTNPNKTNYIIGEALDLTGAKITANYDNNTSGEINVTSSMVTGYNKNLIGQQKITVTYGGKVADFNVTVNDLPKTITSSTYAINAQGYIGKIEVNTQVSSFISKLSPSINIKVYNGSTEISGSAIIGTGMTVKLINGTTVIQSLTIVVTGDTNGDGVISVTDMLSVKSVLLGKSTLSDAKAIAADINGDGTITITDFIKIKSDILGKEKVVSR